MAAVSRQSTFGHLKQQQEQLQATSTATKPALGYWDNRTIAEPLRLLLALAGVEYDDIRYPVGEPPDYDKSEWLEAKHSLGLPAPNLPYYIEPESGLRLTQSRVILMHVATKHGLAGESAERRALVHLAVECMTDWFDDLMAVTYCNLPTAQLTFGNLPSQSEPGVHVAGQPQAKQTSPKFERLRARYLAEKLPKHLATIARLLAGETGWLVGSPTPTCADLMLFEYLDQHLAFAPNCLESSFACSEVSLVFLASLKDHHKRVLALPRIAAYRSSPGFRAEPLHNRYSHFHRGWVGVKRAEPDPITFEFAAGEPSATGRVKRFRKPTFWRDVLCFVALFAAVALLIVIGQNAIKFTPEQQAEQQLFVSQFE